MCAFRGRESFIPRWSHVNESEYFFKKKDDLEMWRNMAIRVPFSKIWS